MPRFLRLAASAESRRLLSACTGQCRRGTCQPRSSQHLSVRIWPTYR